MASLSELCSRVTRKAILIGPQDLFFISKTMPGTEWVMYDQSDMVQGSPNSTKHIVRCQSNVNTLYVVLELTKKYLHGFIPGTCSG